MSGTGGLNRTVTTSTGDWEANIAHILSKTKANLNTTSRHAIPSPYPQQPAGLGLMSPKSLSTISPIKVVRRESLNVTTDLNQTSSYALSSPTQVRKKGISIHLPFLE